MPPTRDECQEREGDREMVVCIRMLLKGEGGGRRGRGRGRGDFCILGWRKKEKGSGLSNMCVCVAGGFYTLLASVLFFNPTLPLLPRGDIDFQVFFLKEGRSWLHFQGGRRKG